MISNQVPIKSSVSVPVDFAVCNLSDCVKRDSCLRYVAKSFVSSQQPCVLAVNPSFVTPEQLALGTCSAYVKSERVTIARGFLAALNTVPIGNKKHVELQLRQRFSQSGYYRIRKGTRILSPEEQQFVERTLMDNGAAQPVVFDAYEEDFLWSK